MFGIVHYEIFLLAGIILNLTPGPDTIYVLSRSISQGRRAGIYSALGISSGGLVHTLLAALGLSVILAQSYFAFTIVKLAGAFYLAYLGVTTLLAKNSTLASPNVKVMSNQNIYLQGLLTNVLNPKVALFFLSFLPQFIILENSYGILPFILLGITFVTTGTLWCLILAFFSAGLTNFLRQGNRVTIMNKVCGGIYLLLGVKILTVER
ncbi:threonine/homoserine/homoserine lactone efflux protein [Sporomusaceae bacterium BoRhaA]|uniref:LysE family translocator n=1 Tax=Pelorhabdus rhamnosifermentans TaxID=2772457 RepID=UPI001C05FB6F|nr:LysE family translocator [Pelorhabdus rhamnosifermentans]MBU2700034.1 threonine/homoserine/homoserine lactone efflux protein [Pelorhabdus rhamnosifermentans]